MVQVNSGTACIRYENYRTEKLKWNAVLHVCIHVDISHSLNCMAIADKVGRQTRGWSPCMGLECCALLETMGEFIGVPQLHSGEYSRGMVINAVL